MKLNRGRAQASHLRWLATTAALPAVDCVKLTDEDGIIVASVGNLSEA